MQQTILTHYINAPIEQVMPFFDEFIKFGDAHPLINKVEITDKNEAVFYESAKIFGLIKQNFSYRAKMTKDEKKHSVTMFAEPKPSVFLELKFAFFEDESQTKIIEEIKINASYLIARILRKEVIKSHKKLVENIRIMVQ